jgi:SAM-dependent methyltransferase
LALVYLVCRFLVYTGFDFPGGSMTDLVKSISNSEEEIIQGILKLHCKTPIELDPTYSKGNFYKGAIAPPKYKFDINPQVEGVEKANAEDLPFNNDSIHTIMFDPPFLATTGPSLMSDANNNKINKRFGTYPTEKALHLFYVNALKEFYRILKSDGVLIFKCQDKVSSGKQYMSHVFIINEAEKLGFYCGDLFILEAKNRIIANWQRNQQHGRKFHSYFVVFKKNVRRIEYI